MQVNKISFKGVYQAVGKEFSPQQNKICERITDTLTSTYYADKKGHTPSDNFKKAGYDTILYPNGNDDIDVYVVTDYKRGNETEHETYKNGYMVGTYNNRSLFSSNDIAKIIKKNNSFGNIFFIPLTALSVFAAIALMKNSTTTQTIQKEGKNITIDSIKHTIETIQNDTVKLLK